MLGMLALTRHAVPMQRGVPADLATLVRFVRARKTIDDSFAMFVA